MKPDLTLIENTLMMFENRVLRRFGHKREEVTEECRKLRNEELHNLYSSLSKWSKEEGCNGHDTQHAWDR
jgi:hypothetical protein